MFKRENLRTTIPLLVCLFLIIFMFIYYFNKSRLTYVFQESTNTYYVDKAYGNSKSYTIPKEYNGKAVTGISVRAFYDHSNLEEVIFESPELIKTVERLSFSKCPKLKTIDLRYVKTIERNAFSYDETLNNIETGAKNIGASAFYKCTGLKNVVLNEGVETLGELSFSYTSISHLKLPKSMKTVYNNAFEYLDTLEELLVYYQLNSTYLKNLPAYVSYN